MFNGKAKLIDSLPVQIGIFQTDASLSGFGIYFDGDWLAGSWQTPRVPQIPQWVDYDRNWTSFSIPEEICDNINYLELYPVLIAARRWGAYWKNMHIVVYTDNTKVVSFINKGTCKTLLLWNGSEGYSGCLLYITFISQLVI